MATAAKTVTIPCPNCECSLVLSLQHQNKPLGLPSSAPVAQQPPSVPPAASKKSCASWAFSKLVWGVGKVASVFCGSASNQLTSGSCVNLGVKAVYCLKDIQKLPQQFMTMNLTLAGNTTITAIKEMVTQQFSGETLAEFSACGQAGLDSLDIMPSSALVVAIATDTLVSQVLLAAIGASWLTTALQMGASLYASSYACGGTVKDVKELVIGYTIYRLADGIYNYMTKT